MTHCSFFRPPSPGPLSLLCGQVQGLLGRTETVPVPTLVIPHYLSFRDSTSAVRVCRGLGPELLQAGMHACDVLRFSFFSLSYFIC